jgi:UDP-N-acetylmuramate--alanine ligase
LPGKVYAYDNLAAAALLIALGVEPERFLPYFERYSGIERRYQIVSDGDVTVIDDYAHHATAVAATLAATAQKYPNRRIICVFEPHTYSRTRETVGQLATAFRDASVTYIAEVYPAREQKLASSITGHDVVVKILTANPGADVRYVANRAGALTQLKRELKVGDVVVVMAVGSFNTLVNDLKKIAV